jgi:hypothetical protein
MDDIIMDLAVRGENRKGIADLTVGQESRQDPSGEESRQDPSVGESEFGIMDLAADGDNCPTGKCR